MNEPTVPDDFGITAAANDASVSVLWERHGGEVRIHLIDAAAPTARVCTDLPPGASREN